MAVEPGSGLSCSRGERLSDGDGGYEAHDVLVISDGLPVGTPPAWLGVSRSLTPGEKWVFLLTNAPYFVVASLVAASPTIPVACSWHCLGGGCASVMVHAFVLYALAFVSTYWHGAQSQLMEPIYCPSRKTGLARLHTAPWLSRLIVGDIACAVMTFGVGLCCFGASRTLSWVAPALVLFVGGSVAKRRRQYQRYAMLHGLWHAASAVAIHQIVLTESTLFGWAIQTT